MLHIPRQPFHVFHWAVYRPARTFPLQVLSVIAAVLTGIAALVAALNLTTTSPALPQISATVQGYINQWQPSADPLLALDNGAQVKTSNYYGVDVAGVRYFYRLSNTFSADPISRGEPAEKYEVVTTVDPGTQWEATIYRIK